MASSNDQVKATLLSKTTSIDDGATSNTGWLSKISNTWVEKCQVVGNQTCIRVVNESPFELEASLSVLGVVYAKVTVPAASKVGINPNATYPSSVGVANLTCGYVWYTVSICGVNDDGVSGQDVSIRAVYGGSRVRVCGTDTRWLSVETKNVDGAPESNQPGVMQKLAEVFDTAVVGPINKAMTDFQDDWETAHGHMTPSSEYEDLLLNGDQGSGPSRIDSFDRQMN